MNKTIFSNRTLNMLNHEVRTNLTIILGFVDKLHDKTFTPTQRRYYVKNIHEAGNDLLEAIQTLLPSPCSSVPTKAEVVETKSTISLPLLLN